MENSTIRVSKDGSMMVVLHGELHLHFHYIDESVLLGKLAGMSSSLNALVTQGLSMDATMQQVKAGMNQLITDIGVKLAEKDALIAQFRIDLAAALAAAGVSTSEQADINELASDLQVAHALVVPAGVTVPLSALYVDRAAFDAAVGAYTGPEGVSIADVGGAVTQAKSGTPVLAYFTHADGSISTTAPGGAGTVGTA